MSDYVFLIIEVISDDIIRTTNSCARSDFISYPGGLYTDIFHGALDSSTGIPARMSRIIFTYVDDTHVRVYLGGTKAIKNASIIGVNLI